MTVQTKNLEMHPKLLLDVIKRQAGTLEKAVLEGVMNAIEAGANKVDIKLDPDNSVLYISDDGHGITSEKEIEQYFATFGTPHEKSENKIWAQFRMGRGQLFSFGKNIWETSNFKMKVDIKNWGLVYKLKKIKVPVNGCNIKIELYENPIGKWNYPTIDSFKDRIQHHVQFMPLPIYFNGKQINTPATEIQWDKEDENAYYSFGLGLDMSIYNLGAFVTKLPVSQTGVPGVVVSKKQLGVNFARNDIQSSCPVYKEIQEVIRENRIKKTRRKSGLRLTHYERQTTLTDIRDGIQKYDEVKNIGLLLTSSGRYITLEQIRKNKQFWCFAPEGNRMADNLMEQGAALVFEDVVLSNLNYTGERRNFFSWLLQYQEDLVRGWDTVVKLHREFQGKGSLTDGFLENYITLADLKLNIVERRVLKALNKMRYWKDRIITIGTSDSARAWTDGNSFITLNRSFIKGLCLSDAGNVAQLFAVLVHELAHDDSTMGSHIHGEEFYRNFHEICMSKRWDTNPLSEIRYFSQVMQNFRVDEKIQKIKEKEEKAKVKRDKKLGVVMAQSSI